MNYLAHLWLTERAQLPLAGAVLGDFLRGRLQGLLPARLEASVLLHRRVDVATDAHPRVAAARVEFGPGARRYAGIVLDIVYDHCLALRWEQFSAEPLERFAARAAQAVAAERRGFALAQAPVPSASRLRELLLSYTRESAVDTAIRRTATRLRQPQPLLELAPLWRAHLAHAFDTLPVLLDALGAVADAARVDAPG
jgi:acyl carrier protein phosphodiesterase